MAINRFEQILDFYDRDIEEIMQKIDPIFVAKILANSTEEIQNKIFKNISEEAVKLIKKDLKHMETYAPSAEYINELKDDIVRIINRLFPNHDKYDAGKDEWA